MGIMKGGFLGSKGFYKKAIKLRLPKNPYFLGSYVIFNGKSTFVTIPEKKILLVIK